MSRNNANGDKKKMLLEHKEKLLKEIKYYEKRIEDFRGNTVTKYYDESSDEEDFPMHIDSSASLSQLSHNKVMLETCIQATEELTSLIVLQSEVNVLVDDPGLNGEATVKEDGTWREVTAECRIDVVPFSIMFLAHTPTRMFGPPSYCSLKVLVSKTSQELELSHSMLSTVLTPSNAVEMLRSYASAYRSRRTTLARLADKFATELFMEPMPEGGCTLKCANLLEINWKLENKKSYLAAFHHKMTFYLDSMEKSYVKSIKHLKESLGNPSLTTDERTLLLAKVINICLEAKGMENESGESAFENTPIPDEPVAKKRKENRTDSVKTFEKDGANNKDISNTNAEKSDEQIMAPPKTLPKKAKRKSNLNEGDNRKALKRTQIDDVSSNKRAKLDENVQNKENLVKDDQVLASSDKNLAKNDKDPAKNDKNPAKNDKKLPKDDINNENENKNVAIDKNKAKASVTEFVQQKEAKTKQPNESVQNKQKVQEKASNSNEKDKNKKSVVPKTNKDAKNGPKTNSEAKTINTKEATNKQDGTTVKDNALKNDLAKDGKTNKVASVKTNVAKNVANEKGAKNDGKTNLNKISNAKNDIQKINKASKTNASNKNVKSNDKAKSSSENLKNKHSNKTTEQKINKENKNLNSQTNINKNMPKPTKPNTKEQNKENKIQKIDKNIGKNIQNTKKVTKPTIRNDPEKYDPKLIANKRFPQLSPKNFHESPKRSPRLSKIALSATFSIEKVTIGNVAMKNKEHIANIASIKKIDKPVKNLAKQPLTGNIKKANNINNFKAGNIVKENVSKIPQKFQALSESSVRNQLRNSPRNLATIFKSTSDSNVKKIQKAITNIPRLMKKPVPKPK